jgi:hypothetical protein
VTASPVDLFARLLSEPGTGREIVPKGTELPVKTVLKRLSGLFLLFRR